jgi:hypothetical protein
MCSLALERARARARGGESVGKEMAVVIMMMRDTTFAFHFPLGNWRLFCGSCSSSREI